MKEGADWVMELRVKRDGLVLRSNDYKVSRKFLERRLSEHVVGFVNYKDNDGTIEATIYKRSYLGEQKRLL